MERVWRELEAGAADAGRALDRDRFPTCNLTTMTVLRPGEATDSDRVKRQCGAMAMATVHYAYDQWRETGRRPGGPVAEIWDDYTALLAEVPEEVRHQRVHAGHNCWVVPEEERFLTRDLLERTCMVGTAEDLAARLRALGDAGLDQVMILPNLDARSEVLEEVAAEVLPLL
jgi:alkanesulfonate monooxygenase SsuD/methylene tetrahydromethanopterin reductase-like flavin-dependent oxidoreductase (luciferase family)